mmetsp:Transcript_44571/g.59145  ORF Transcript_44571/g.59145 Transcript_44571/m.59145 type:complete len:81 (-) Transcript_44571:140-382(-)
MYCADMKGEDMILQNTIFGDWTKGRSFHFAVDTCENFAQYTGNDECEPNSIVEPMLAEFTLFQKTSYRFYSTETFMYNDE